MTSCAACQQGSFSSAAGSSVCAPCTPGYYAPNLGGLSCASCPAGSFSNASSSRFWQWFCLTLSLPVDRGFSFSLCGCYAVLLQFLLLLRRRYRAGFVQ